ncbi:hypothetical protein ACOMCU_00505 [Lysinibacillus sp. UGB7]|uniref:hypothetical protein n=1 Tax=Lysinibacillus sp. UGB7 TaxID=3411039 RepID=UPI003B79B495
MENKSLDEITNEVLKLYEKGKETQEIAKLCSIPEYLVESILIQIKGIYFR